VAHGGYVEFVKKNYKPNYPSYFSYMDVLCD